MKDYRPEAIAWERAREIDRIARATLDRDGTAWWVTWARELGSENKSSVPIDKCIQMD